MDRRATIPLAAAAIAALSLLRPAPAAAQEVVPEMPPDATPAVRAEILYKRGHALMAAGRYAEACPVIEESEHLDAEMGTLLNLAFCHDHEGKPGRAWREFQRAKARCLREGDKRAVFADDNAKELVARVAWIELSPPPGAKVTDVAVDGEVVPREVALRFAVDAGPHAVTLRVNGQPWEHTAVSVVPSTVQLAIDAPAPAPSAAPAPAIAPAPPPAAAEQASSGGGRRIAGIVLGGVGVAGIAVGAVFGVETLSEKSKANQSGCTNGTGCLPGTDGRSIGERAWTDSAVSTVAFGVGLAALAAGTWLLVASRPAATTAAAPPIRVSPYAGPGGAGLTAVGIW